MQVDHQKYALELLTLGWLVQIHDGKSAKLAPTRLGIKSISIYEKIISNPVFSNPGRTGDNSAKYDWLLKNGILTRYYDVENRSEVIAVTPYGYGLFFTIKSMTDERLQKRLARRKKLEQFVSSAKKNLGVFMEFIGDVNSRTKSADLNYGGHRK
ncbi:MAG: hypothetical protein ACKOCL_03480 [Candidatus Nanopelagicaceae bacterium]